MYQNTIYICISWYCKISWFLVKNADVSRTKWVCHVIHIFCGSSLDKVWLYQVSSLWDMCDRFYGRGTFLPPPLHPWAALKKPILNSVDKQGIRKFFYQQAILLSVYIWKLSMEVASYSTKSIAKITSILVLFWLIQAIQQWCHSTNSPWW